MYFPYMIGLIKLGLIKKKYQIPEFKKMIEVTYKYENFEK